MQNTSLFDQILRLAKRLPPKEKIRLIEQIAPEIEQDLAGVSESKRQSLRGAWREIDITEEDISTARQEMWGEFPRGDF